MHYRERHRYNKRKRKKLQTHHITSAHTDRPHISIKTPLAYQKPFRSLLNWANGGVFYIRILRKVSHVSDRDRAPSTERNI